MTHSVRELIATITLALVVPHVRLHLTYAARHAAAVVWRRLEPAAALAGQGRGFGAGRYIHGVGHARAMAGTGGGVAKEGTREAFPNVERVVSAVINQCSTRLRRAAGCCVSKQVAIALGVDDEAGESCNACSSSARCRRQATTSG